MKNNKVKLHLSFVMLLLIGVFITSCSSKLKPLQESLFNVTPSPMEVTGGKIPVTVNGKFPEKWFNKNLTVVVTPVLKFQGNEVLGTSQTFQGENVAGNGIVIPQKTGGNFTIKSVFDFVPQMQNPELYLRFETSMKGKKIALPDLKIAEGLISTATLANAFSTTPALAPDKFQRIIKEAYDADILFLIQQAELRSSELNSSNLGAWKKLVKDVYNDDRKYLSVEVSAYASPDGGLELNEPLAEKREKNTTNYLNKEFLKNEIDTEVTAKYTAQDWEGFKKLVEASSLQDKDLVLRVLSMYPDPETREREIKNISFVYKELAETILPKLRRSRLTANVEIVGKTDQELVAAINSNSMNTLSLEELLYAANIDGVSKEKIYTYVTQKYPADYRGWNNLGAFYFANNQTDKAKDAFNKAIQIAPRSAEPNMNTALFSLAEGDMAKAQELLGFASSANSINEALGLLYLKSGDYSKAVQAFGDSKTDNAALAQIMTKNYSQAQKTLSGVNNKTANTYYLLAIVSARTNDMGGVIGNLKEATSKNPALKSQILGDLEFAKFVTNPDFANMLR